MKARQPAWLPFVLPMLVFLVVGTMEPRPPSEADQRSAALAADAPPQQEADRWFDVAVPYRYYPAYYTLRIVLTVAVIVFYLPTYRAFPWRVHLLSLWVGAAGALLWIGLCRMNWEASVLPQLGLGGMLTAGSRPGYDPLTSLADAPLALIAFLVVRFFGLVFVVAFVEEFFLRGFLMRYFIAPQWWDIPIGQLTPMAIAIGTVYGILAHPAEILAAACWFSLITWLVWRTRSIWDAIVAHAVTNFGLGVYIVVWRDWSLW